MTNLDIALAAWAVVATLVAGFFAWRLSIMTDNESKANDAINRSLAAQAALQAKLDAAGAGDAEAQAAAIEKAVDDRFAPIAAKAEGLASSLESMAGTTAAS